jgi:raffinose/stachyose/melibiose transport system permease protein
VIAEPMPASIQLPEERAPRAGKPGTPRKMRKNELIKPGVSGWLMLSVLIIAVLAWVFPLWLTVVNAFKTSADLLENGPVSVPTTITFANITDFWTQVNFSQKLWNSIQISGWTALLAIVLSFLTAYAIGIGRIKFRMWVLGLFMIAFTIPQEALIYPVYVMAKSVGLYDNIWSVIIFFAVTQSAFGAYMLSSVLSEFPTEILEAARIDGAGTLRLLWSVVLPIVRPTLLMLATFFFIWTWNEFLLPLVLLPSNANQTVALSLGATSGQYTSDPVRKAAAALLGLLPSLIFFFIFQRTLLRGVTMGAVK